MENFLITEKTIALLKKKTKTIIYNVDKVEVINKNIKQILEFNCNYYGSSLFGRKKCAQNILNIKYKVPIIIEENKNLILIQMNSLRKEECLFLMTNKIIDYNEINNNLEVYCYNNKIFNIKISKNNFEKLIVNALKLNNILIWRKNGNLL